MKSYRPIDPSDISPGVELYEITPFSLSFGDPRIDIVTVSSTRFEIHFAKRFECDRRDGGSDCFDLFIGYRYNRSNP